MTATPIFDALLAEQDPETTRAVLNAFDIALDAELDGIEDSA